jgi:hypothetical protein
VWLVTSVCSIIFLPDKLNLSSALVVAMISKASEIGSQTSATCNYSHGISWESADFFVKTMMFDVFNVISSSMGLVSEIACLYDYSDDEL